MSKPRSYSKRRFLSRLDMAMEKMWTAIRNSQVKCGKLPAHDEGAIQMPKPTPKQDDIQKIERLGFDPIWSFRKRPKDAQ